MLDLGSPPLGLLPTALEPRLTRADGPEPGALGSPRGVWGGWNPPGGGVRGDSPG